MQMSGPHLSGEGSKQPQVSALPERRVKKQKWTALWDLYLSIARCSFFCFGTPTAIPPAFSGILFALHCRIFFPSANI